LLRVSAARASWLLAAVLAVGVGCGDDESEEPAKPAGEEIAGSVVQYADCTDWRKATVAEREATITALKGQLTPQTAQTPTSALDDDKAYEILQNFCRAEFSDKLRLYKIYAKAQGFSPLYP
jgi:hypothetical protein